MQKRIFVSWLAMLVLLVAPALSISAQDSLHSWSRVQSIGTNERLIVKQKNGKSITGDMIEATESNLTIDHHGKVTHIPRNDIAEIQLSKGKASKAKWTLIGTGIGAATGGAIGGAKMSSTLDDGGIYVVAGLLIGAGAGAAGGALYGGTRRDRELIYTTP